MINFNRQCLHKTHAAMDTMTYVTDVHDTLLQVQAMLHIVGDVTSFRRDEWFSRRKLGSFDIMSLLFFHFLGTNNKAY
jgi:hypothetical protein